ncbi:MAG: hypothetical protein E7213_06390 [Clostridium sp.]|nr:hypothetical protein [Clostridium sp.]
MEKVVFIRKAVNVNKVLDSYNRIYFGEEFCQNRLQQPQDFELVQKAVKERGKKLTLVFPYLTDEGIEKLDEILKVINLNEKELEIVANDWGTVYHLRKLYKDINIIPGRLLNKIRRDPRIKSAEKFLDEKTYNIFRSSNLLTDSSLKFLKSQKVKAIEFDYPMQGLNLKDTDLSYYVHFPIGYISTGRHCIFNPSVFKSGHDYKCNAKLCEKVTLKEENSAFSTRVYQKGNTVFYYNNSITKEELLNMGFERIIEHNGL